MAKSDLLKEAIADAKAVKETALANAKLALQEAFAPRMERMLATKLSEELEDEDMDEPMDDAGMDEPMDDAGMDEPMDEPMDDAGMDDEWPDTVGVGIDWDSDGEYDYEGDLPRAGVSDEEDDMEMEDDMAATGSEEDMEMEDDLDLAEIIRELEDPIMGADDDTDVAETDEGIYENTMFDEDANYDEEMADMADKSIDELIEAILSEEDDEKTDQDPREPAGESYHSKEDKQELNDVKKELDESYRTVRHLKSVINEVNLLNAKLLYTNKLFRNFELNESQKMKVIENFDRATTTREAKLVFTTLAESFKRPKMVARKPKKNVVKESKSYASRPTRGTAPSYQTTQVLNEGFEYANRWKKLAGLL